MEICSELIKITRK